MEAGQPSRTALAAAMCEPTENAPVHMAAAIAETRQRVAHQVRARV
jgi:hypothetical protein